MREKAISLVCVMCLFAGGCQALTGAGNQRGDEGALYVADASSPQSGRRGMAGSNSSRGHGTSVPLPKKDTAVTMASGDDKQKAAAPSSLTESLHDALGQVKEQRARIKTLNETVTELKQKLAAKTKEVEQLQSDLAERDERVKKLQGAVGKWKQDILGYRDEMRQAEEAEMKALTRIIALLKKCSTETDKSKTGAE